MSSFTIRYISYSQKSTVASFSHCGSYIELLEQGAPHRIKNIYVRKFRGSTEKCLLDMAAYAVRIYFRAAFGAPHDSPVQRDWSDIQELILNEMTSYAESCINSRRIDLCALTVQELVKSIVYLEDRGTGLIQRMEDVVARYKQAREFKSIIDEMVKDI